MADLRRVQKAAVRVIMGRDYINYEDALNVLNIPELTERRNTLEKNMALRACRNKKIKHIFPLRAEYRAEKRRHTEKYIVKKANTEQLKKSSIPHMQRVLSTHNKAIHEWI